MIEYIAHLTIGQVICDCVAASAVVLTCVEKSKKIGWQPWTKLFLWLGNCFNSELLEKVKVLEGSISACTDEISAVREELCEFKAVTNRVEIIDFADELRRDIKHSKDAYDKVLISITKYIAYCDANKRFLNGVAEASINLIKESYQERLRNNDFLV